MMAEREKKGSSETFLPGVTHLVGLEDNGLSKLLSNIVQKKAQEEKKWKSELPRRLEKTLGPRHGRPRARREIRDVRSHFEQLQRSQPGILDPELSDIINDFSNEVRVPASEKFSHEEFRTGVRDFYFYVCNRPAEEATGLLIKPTDLQTLWECFFSRFILARRVGEVKLNASQALNEFLQFAISFEFSDHLRKYIEEIARQFSYSRNSTH